jgi:putative oxidoreductase
VSTRGDDDGLFYPQSSLGGYGERTTANLPIGGASSLDEVEHRRVPKAPTDWHGGADFGLFVLRLAIGALFVGHGLQHVFGLFDGIGRAGFGQYIAAAGYTNTDILAWICGLTELVGGVLVIVGLFTSVALSGLLALSVSVIMIQWGGSLDNPAYLYELLRGVLVFALLFTGPGRFSLERHTPWYRHPVLNGFIFLIIAAVAVAAGLYLFM